MFAESAWCIPTQELYQAYHEIVTSVTDWQYYGVISVTLAPGSNSSLDHQTCLNWNRFSKSADRNHHHENTVQWFYRRQYPNLKLFLIFTYTVATSFVLETPIHAFPEIKKNQNKLPISKAESPYVCMFWTAEVSRAKTELWVFLQMPEALLKTWGIHFAQGMIHKAVSPRRMPVDNTVFMAHHSLRYAAPWNSTLFEHESHDSLCPHTLLL